MADGGDEENGGATERSREGSHAFLWRHIIASAIKVDLWFSFMSGIPLVPKSIPGQKNIRSKITEKKLNSQSRETFVDVVFTILNVSNTACKGCNACDESCFSASSTSPDTCWTLAATLSTRSYDMVERMKRV